MIIAVHDEQGNHLCDYNFLKDIPRQRDVIVIDKAKLTVLRREWHENGELRLIVGKTTGTDIVLAW